MTTMTFFFDIWGKSFERAGIASQVKLVMLKTILNIFEMNILFQKLLIVTF